MRMMHIGSFSALFITLVAAAVVIAILERVYARRNEVRLLSEGAEETAPWVFRVMAPVYSASFPAAVAEHLLLGRRPSVFFAAAMIMLFLLAKGLKIWAIVSLGDLWTMRVILPRPLRVVTGGPYRFLRHPNYVAVLVELTALPLAGGAFITAAAAGALFLALLWVRVRTEEAALLARPEYAAAMGSRRRFIPGGR
jgi:methyltransferase